jgi:signal transduction histidine kinase
VYKHACASAVVVTLGFGHGFTLEVADDGRGFDAAGERLRGRGLKNMRQRAELAGGELTVCSELAGGTSVTFTVPAPAKEPAT